MIDATTLQQTPCPICDSTAVRWRGRRFYDVPLTWGRTIVEGVYSALFGAGGTTRTLNRRYIDIGAKGRAIRNERLEAQTGMRTPTAFWRCPDCRNRGFVFEPRAAKSGPRVEDRTRPPGT